MKTIKLLTLILCVISFNGFSQRRFEEKKEKIKSLKIAYITNELNLTPDEATKFWPLFNAFETRQSEIRIQKIKGYLDRMDDDILNRMSDKEANALLIQLENTEEDLYTNKKKFLNNLKGVLPPIKIIKLKRAEDNFNKKLLQQYRDKK